MRPPTGIASSLLQTYFRTLLTIIIKQGPEDLQYEVGGSEVGGSAIT